MTLRDFWLYLIGLAMGVLIGMSIPQSTSGPHSDWRIESEDGSCYMFYSDEEWEAWQRGEKQ